MLVYVLPWAGSCCLLHISSGLQGCMPDFQVQSRAEECSDHLILGCTPPVSCSSECLGLESPFLPSYLPHYEVIQLRQAQRRCWSGSAQPDSVSLAGLDVHADNLTLAVANCKRKRS